VFQGLMGNIGNVVSGVAKHTKNVGSALADGSKTVIKGAAEVIVDGSKTVVKETAGIIVDGASAFQNFGGTSPDQTPVGNQLKVSMM